jgi:hypothetical protein
VKGRQERNALRFFEPGDAPQTSSRPEVDDFEGTVAQGGYEQTLPGRIDGQVIDALLNTGKRNHLRLLEWRGSFGARARAREQNHRDGGETST